MEKRDRPELGNSLEDAPYIRLAVLPDVLEMEEGWPVELWMNGKGRVFVRAYSQSGCCHTHVDVLDLMTALRGSEYVAQKT